MSYVFCRDKIFPLSLWQDKGLADTLAGLPHADSILPMGGRHAVALCADADAASPALLA